MIYHRCTFGISLHQRWQHASLFKCWHSGIQFQWGLCWWRQWVCCSAEVLHQGLPVRHWLVWSQEVKSQNTWGWCHWCQHPWPTGKWHHRCGSRWSLWPSWAVHTEGQSRWTGPGWRDWGMLPCLGTPGVWWHLLVLVGHVQHWHYLGLGGHHQHCKGNQRSWQLGPLHVFFWGLNTNPYLQAPAWGSIDGHHVLLQCSHGWWYHLWSWCIIGTPLGSGPSTSGRCLWSQQGQRGDAGNSIFQRDCWMLWEGWSPDQEWSTSIHGRHPSWWKLGVQTCQWLPPQWASCDDLSGWPHWGHGDPSTGIVHHLPSECR